MKNCRIKTVLTLAVLAMACFAMTTSAQAGLVGQLGLGGAWFVANPINPGTGVAWQAGDTYQLAFSTNAVTIASINPPVAPWDDIATFDAIVQAEADAGGIGAGAGVTWNVIGSTVAVNAKDHAVVSAPVYDMLGRPIVTGYADMWDGSIENPITYMDGTPVTSASYGSMIWTGSRSDGTAYAGRELGTATRFAQGGRSYQTDGKWISDSRQDFYRAMSLYSLSEPLVVMAEVYWDLNGTDPNSGSSTPAGTWNAGTENWNAAADGTGAVGVWTPGAAAKFAAGDDANGTYVVTVNGMQDIGGLAFEEGTVTIANGTAGELRMTGYDNSMDVASGLTATVATPISDDGNSWTLAKTGSGTLVLSGANIYTGATVIQAGTLQLDANDVIPDTSDVTVNGALDLADNSDTIAALALGNAGTVTTGAGTLTLGGDVAYSGSGAGATISGNLAFGAAPRTVTVNNASAVEDLTISADITGSGGMVKEGAGTLVLSGDNIAATGGTTINAGVAQYESPGAINGTARDVTVNAGGAVVFGPSFETGTDIPTALLTRIVASSAGVIAADNYDTTAFDFSSATGAGLTGASLGAVGDVTYTGTLTPNAATYRLGGGGGMLTMANANAVTGEGSSLVVSGPGTVVLANANDYDGTTTISGGALQMGDAASLGTSQSVAFSTGSTGKLQLYGHDLTLANLTDDGGAPVIENGTDTAVLTVNNPSDLSYGGTIQNGGGTLALTKEGTGALTLSGGPNTYSGDTSISAGTLRLGASDVIGDSSNVTVSTGAVLDMNGYGDTIKTLEGTGNVTSTATASTLTLVNGSTFDGVISGDGLSVTFTRGGTLTNQNTYGGSTRIGWGGVYNVTLKLGIDNALPVGKPVKADGSGACALDLNGYDQTVGLLSFGSNNGSQRGQVKDSAGGGTLTLTNGVFCDDHNGGNGGIYVTTLDLNGAMQTFTVQNGSGAVDLDVTSVIQNGGVTMVGNKLAATMGLSGELLYTGGTIIESGTLSYTNVNNGLDDASIVEISTDAKMDLNFEGEDTIAALVLNGLDVGKGTFDSDHETYGSYFTGTGSLLVADVSPGDANGDGVVDSADYIMVKTHFGGPPAAGTEGTGGDFNGNGTVDWEDLQKLMSGLNSGTGGAPIPEPATLALLAVGAMALIRRRRS